MGEPETAGDMGLADTGDEEARAEKKDGVWEGDSSGSCGGGGSGGSEWDVPDGVVGRAAVEHRDCDKRRVGDGGDSGCEGECGASCAVT